MERSLNLLIPRFEDQFEGAETLSSKTFSDKIAGVCLNPTSEDVNDEPHCDSDSDSDDEFEEVPQLKQATQEEEDDESVFRLLGFSGGRSSEAVQNFNLKFNIGIKETEDNKIIIEILRDLYKELKHSHLDRINIWIKVIYIYKKIKL
jgi:hypothetical protein